MLCYITKHKPALFFIAMYKSILKQNIICMKITYLKFPRLWSFIPFKVTWKLGLVVLEQYLTIYSLFKSSFQSLGLVCLENANKSSYTHNSCVQLSKMGCPLLFILPQRRECIILIHTQKKNVITLTHYLEGGFELLEVLYGVLNFIQGLLHLKIQL